MSSSMVSNSSPTKATLESSPNSPIELETGTIRSSPDSGFLKSNSPKPKPAHNGHRSTGILPVRTRYVTGKMPVLPYQFNIEASLGQIKQMHRPISAECERLAIG